MMPPERFAELVDRHAAALTLYARQWCATPDDIVQQAFLKLIRQATPPENVVGWLYRVVRNAAIDAGRAARRRQKHEATAASQTPNWFIPTEDPTGLDARTASAALATLPEELREIIVAHLWGGLTFEEIANLVGSSASTCYRRFALGLDLLRTQLGVTEPCPNPTTTTI